MDKRKIIANVILVLALIALSACVAPTPAVQPSPTARVAATTPKVVRIGAFAPLTGPVADIGQQIRDGVELAVKNEEAAGFTINGEPYAIELIWGDDESKPEVGQSVVEKLATVHKINAAVGFYSSAIFLRVMDKFQQYKIPIIDANASSTLVFQQIASTKADYVFQLSTTNDDNCRVWVEMLSRTLKPAKVSFIMENSDSGREIGKLTRQYFLQYMPNTTIVTEDYVDVNATDLTPVMNKIKNAKPDMILDTISGASAAVMVQQWAELRVPAQNVHMGGSLIADDFIKAHAKEMERALIMPRWWPGPYSPISEKVVADYKARYNKDPTVFVLQSYDATFVMLEAMKKAGSIDGQKVRDTIANNEWMTVWGTRKFSSLADGQRSPQPDLAIAQIVNGQKVAVWPPAIKAAEILTQPPWPWDK